MSFVFRYLRNRKFSIRITLLGVFIFATFLTATVAVGLQYFFTKKIATDAAISQFNGLANGTSQYLDLVDNRAVEATRMLASYPRMLDNDWVAGKGARDLFAEIMRNNKMFYAIYLGFANGDFYELVNLSSGSAVRKHLHAESGDRWVVIEITGKGQDRKRRFSYYDNQFKLRRTFSQPSDYDASQRPWFIQAVANKINKTAPYLFHNLQAPGQTYSTLVSGTHTVIAIDIALSSLSDFLDKQHISSDSQLFVYQKTGEVIAASAAHTDSKALKLPAKLDWNKQEQAVIDQYKRMSVSNEMDWAPIDFAVAGTPYGYSIDFLSLISALTGIRFNYVNGYDWPGLVSRFEQGDIDMLQPVFKNDTNQKRWLFSEPFMTLPYSLVTLPSQQTVTHIGQIEGWTIAIPKGWSIIEVLQTHYPNIHIKQVASTRAMLEAVANKQVDAGLDIGPILHYIAKQYFFKDLKFDDNIDFSPVPLPNQLHLVLRPSQAELLPILNKAITHIIVEQKLQLAEKWLDHASSGRTSGTVPYPQLIQIANQPQVLRKLHQMQIAGTAYFVYVASADNGRRGNDFFAIVVPEKNVLGPIMHKVMLSITLTIVILLVLSPLCWLFASPIVSAIRKLTDENEKIKQRKYASVQQPRSRIKEIHELGQSMVSMSDSIQHYELNQKQLMDAFIQLIAQAIDDKSPYTAGHCERVPKLAFMLAIKAEESDTPPFKSFAFGSEEAWREFKIAAWLHDCGKITTPEHIVDKGSKLETIYNRIHEIRTRFEVLLRDAEIDYWRQLASHPQQKIELTGQLQQRQQQIKQDFEFIARCNIGGEYLSDADKTRIKQIAKIQWQRNLSDRLGLSPLEEKRLVGEEQPLPTMENILLDKQEHLFEHLHDTDYEPRLGINMTVPRYQYNQGEIHNLLIERGTLTAEDRFKINEHMIATIKMLDNLPFPPELAKVPRYASTHHETMNGTGYPRGLKADDLSIPERIMVLADIFEALTAADRPYKKAKTISEALDILHKMVLDEHVDPAVFELFLRSGVYLDYAHQFLAAEQIDSIDIKRYLAD